MFTDIFRKIEFIRYIIDLILQISYKQRSFIPTVKEKIRILALILQIILLGFCSTIIPKKQNVITPVINVSLGKVYMNFQFSRGNSDQEILKILQILVDSTLQKDFHKLPDLVSMENGLYVDLKGHLTYAKLLEEIQAKDSYFEIFFFNSEKLKKEKKTESVKTVRDLLLLSEGLMAEIYYETKESAEVKMRFQRNQKWERDLNTVILTKKGEKWWVERLF